MAVTITMIRNDDFFLLVVLKRLIPFSLFVERNIQNSMCTCDTLEINFITCTSETSVFFRAVASWLLAVH